MTCNGIFIPKYKKAKQTALNPYYRSTDSNLASLGVNTKDEFIITEVMIESQSVCIDCKKERCSGAKKDEVKKQ